MNKDLHQNRIEPINIDEKRVKSFTKHKELPIAVEKLLSGTYLVVEDYYSTALALQNELHSVLKEIHSGDSFQGKEEFQQEFNKLSNQILFRITENELQVGKAPKIGWLKILYSEVKNFMLTLPQVKELNSAWQWYDKGVSVPVLRNKVKLYYGVTVPSKDEILILFDNWLKRYEGPKKSAMDIGIGSGVLSLQLMKHGFQKSFGTDINNNAIVGFNLFMEGTKLSRKIEIDNGNLFAKWNKQTELIVFSPPCVLASNKNQLNDLNNYYDTNLFPDFFKGAKERLLQDGKIVILFSDFAKINGDSDVNPIEQEIANGGRFKLDKVLTKQVRASKDQEESQEEVELWILSHV